MSQKKSKLFTERELLDPVLSKLRSLNVQQPKRGWVRAVREMLGMSVAQLARRVQLNSSTITRLEQNEAKGTITLQSLEKLAAALNCKLVYALVPEKPLFDMLSERAEKLLQSEERKVDHTMKLENQQKKTSHRQSIRRDVEKAQIIVSLDKRLWDREE